ncbi:MAG TPA: D-aminoacyl-tRNA deacylase [Candidatus Saccharimonadales bacterium]|nr:D-aminoacyl-tRNA deacylase [Candidatus Saccharimonadales bacterium]
MKLVVQRVNRAEVRVEDRTIASIGRGLLILLAVERGDTEAAADAAARKVAALRIFPAPGSERMDLAAREAGGEVLLVSQFTLAASIRRGRRPSFDAAAAPAEAEALCERFALTLRAEGLPVATGRFGAMMEVDLVNDGPVTLWMTVSPAGEIGP